MDVYTISNAVIVSDYLLNVAALTSTPDFAMFVRTVSLLGLLLAYAQAVVNMNYSSVMGYVVSIMLINLTLINGRVNLDIESKRDGSVATVTGVPVGIGVPASLITTLGLNLSELFELGFAPVSGSTFGATGNFISGTDDPFFHVRSVSALGRLFSDSNNLKAVKDIDPNFRIYSNMVRYVAQCVHVKAMKSMDTANAISRQDIWSQDIFTVLEPGIAATIPIVLFENPPVEPGERTCAQAWTLINQRLPFTGVGGIVATIPLTAWRDAVQSDAQYFIGCLTSDDTPAAGVPAPTDTGCFGNIMDNVNLSGASGGMTGPQYVTAAMWRIAVEEGLRSSALEYGEAAHASAMDTAIRQRAAQWRGESGIFLRSIATFAGFIEAFSFSIGPLMLLVFVLGPAGVRIGVKYLWLLVWLQLWFPMLSIVNFMMYTLVAYGNPLLGNTLELSLNSLELYEEHIINVSSTVDYSITMITALATMLVYGASAIVSNTVSQRMQGQDHYDESVAARAAIGSSPLRSWSPEATVDRSGITRNSAVATSLGAEFARSVGATSTDGSVTGNLTSTALGASVGSTAASGQAASQGANSSSGTFVSQANGAGVVVRTDVSNRQGVGNSADVRDTVTTNDGSSGEYGASARAGASAALVGAPPRDGGGGGQGGTVAGAAAAAARDALAFRPGVNIGGGVDVNAGMRMTEGRDRAESVGHGTTSQEGVDVQRGTTGTRGFQQQQGSESRGGAAASNMQEHRVGQDAALRTSTTDSRSAGMESRDAVHGSSGMQSSVDLQTAAQKFAAMDPGMQSGWMQAAYQQGMWGKVNDILMRHGDELTKAFGGGNASVGFAMFAVMGGHMNTADPDPAVRAARQAMGNQMLADVMGWTQSGGYGGTPTDAVQHRDRGMAAPDPVENDINAQVAAQFDRSRRGVQSIQPGGPGIARPLPQADDMAAAGIGHVAQQALPRLEAATDAIIDQARQVGGHMSDSNSLRESIANGGAGLFKNLFPDVPDLPGLSGATGQALDAVGDMGRDVTEAAKSFGQWLGSIDLSTPRAERIEALAASAVDRATERGASNGLAHYAAGVVLEDIAAVAPTSAESAAIMAKAEELKDLGLALSPGLEPITTEFEAAVRNTDPMFGGDSGQRDTFEAFEGFAQGLEGAQRVAGEVRGAEDRGADNRAQGKGLPGFTPSGGRPVDVDAGGGVELPGETERALED